MHWVLGKNHSGNDGSDDGDGGDGVSIGDQLLNFPHHLDPKVDSYNNYSRCYYCCCGDGEVDGKGEDLRPWN